MTKRSKTTKTTKKIKKVKIKREVIAQPIIEEPQEKKSSAILAILNKILKYGLAPTVLVALIGVAPQVLDKVIAFTNNMSYEDYILAQKQLKYWQEHADCIAGKDPIVITDGHGEIKLRMCDKALILAEFEGKNKGKSTYSWVDLSIKELEKNVTTISDNLYAQHIKSKGTDNSITVQQTKQQEKIMCKINTETEMQLFIKMNDKCKVKKINKLKGSVSIENINCEKICKN